MPAEKRCAELLNDDASSHLDPKLRRCDAGVVLEQQPPALAVVEEVSINNDDRKSPVALHHQLEVTQEPKLEDKYDAVLQEDSDSSHIEDPPEFVYVDLRSIRKEVQCPICLGIIKKTRTVMECLHRFCRECIDKSMRMGNNECPACRTHCASRRSLRDDPRHDELIAALYPDIKKYEEEELAFYEEDEARNKQIQESISQVLIKQSEALGKKRPANKDSAGPSVARSQRKNQSSYPRRKRRRRNSSMEYQDSDDNDESLDIDKQFSPNEHHREIKPRKAKTRGSIGISHSPSATNVSEGSFDDNVEQNKEERGLSPAMICGERLSWGGGGVRSNTRHGNINDGMSKNARRIRLSKLVDFLRNLDENDDEFATPVKDEKFQLMGMQDGNGSHDRQSMLEASSCNDKQSQVVELLQGSLHRLEIEKTTPGETVANCTSNGEQLVLAYPEKEAL